MKFLLGLILAVAMCGSAYGLHPPHNPGHNPGQHHNYNNYSHFYYSPRVYVAPIVPLYVNPYPYTYVSPYVYYPNGTVYMWVNGVLIRVR